MGQRDDKLCWGFNYFGTVWHFLEIYLPRNVSFLNPFTILTCRLKLEYTGNPCSLCWRLSGNGMQGLLWRLWLKPEGPPGPGLNEGDVSVLGAKAPEAPDFLVNRKLTSLSAVRTQSSVLPHFHPATPLWKQPPRGCCRPQCGVPHRTRPRTPTDPTHPLPQPLWKAYVWCSHCFLSPLR